MTVEDEARAEAEKRYPELDPSADEAMYPRSAVRYYENKAYQKGYLAASRREPSERTVNGLTIDDWASIARAKDDAITELIEFQNSIADRMPEEYDGDEAQEALIDHWLDDITSPDPEPSDTDEREWEYKCDDSQYRRYTSDPETAARWLARGDRVWRRTPSIPAGPWEVVPDGE